MQGEIDRIIEQGAAFADSTLGSGQRAQVEFVSANPTGPLHIGNGRGAAIGDTLASVLAAAGYEVEREYYVNDAGTQADVFTDTLYARYQQQFGRDMSIPEGGYPGEYMVDLAAKLREREGDRFLTGPGEPAAPGLRELGIELMVEQIQGTLTAFGTSYDRWFSEQALYEGEEPAYEVALASLREKGHLAEREGALWLTSSAKDNVVVRSDGRPTYFASDIAYHYDKFTRRGFDLVIDVVGGRPPRACLATGCGDGGGHGEGRCPARAPVPSGHAQAGEGDRAPLEAERRDHHARRACRGGGARRGALLLPAARPQFADGVRPGPGGEAVEREPRVLHPIRARAPGRASSIGPSQRGTRPRAGTSPS